MKFIIILTFIFTFNSFAKEIKSRGNSFNPDIGINVLFLDQSSDRDSADDGMQLQEAELQFSSDVDSFLTAKVLFAVAKEAGAYVIEPEEAYVETINLQNITVRAGKSKMPMGKHNELHAHAFPFINAPLANEAILGDEGLNETGLGVSGLVPLPWFSELSLHYVQGENEDLYESDRKGNKIVVGHYKNLWDLSDTTTLEFGLSAASGENKEYETTTLTGADLTIKWRNSDSNSLELSTEFLEKDRQGATDEKLSGVVSHLKFQLAKRWYTQYRYDFVGLNSDKTVHGTLRHTALVAFLPSEFSSIRAQYETIEDGQDEDEKRFSLQLNISIGAHPAHAY